MGFFISNLWHNEWQGNKYHFFQQNQVPFFGNLDLPSYDNVRHYMLFLKGKNYKFFEWNQSQPAYNPHENSGMRQNQDFLYVLNDLEQSHLHPVL